MSQGNQVATMRASRILCFCAMLMVSGVLVPTIGSAQDTAAPAAATEVPDAVHDAHHAPYSFWSDLPFWSGIAFVGFVIAVKKLGLWDLLVRSMSEREQAELQAINIAETNLSDAQSVLRQIKGRLEAMDEQVREHLAEADRDAASTRQHIMELAASESATSMQRAKVEIDRVKTQALNDIFLSLADKVTATAEQRLRTGLGPQDHDRLIGEALGQAVIR